MDYSVIFGLVADVVKSAIPIAIVFTLVERLVHIFFYFAFPKMFKQGGFRMDHSIILSEISASQLELLSVLKAINSGLDCLILLFTIFVLFMYIRIIVKH